VLLNRYILKEFIPRFFSFLCILIVLFVGIDMLTRIWTINAPFSKVITYYFFTIPSVVVRMIPVSVLLATLMLFSYLNTNHELVALYSSGRSLLKISMPVFLFVALVSVFSFYFSEHILPLSNFQAKKTWVVDIEKKSSKFYGSLKRKKTWFRSKKTIYNIKSYSEGNKLLHKVNIYVFDENFNMKKHIYSDIASFNKEQDVWNLKNAKQTDFSENGSFKIKNLSKLNVDIEEKPEDFKKIETFSDYLNTEKLKTYIKDLKTSGLYPAKYIVKLHERYSMAIAGLIMCIIAIPFAVRQRRKGGVALNLGLGFLIVFVYWIFFSVMLSMGISGRINPIISAWGANFLFLIFSFFMYRRVIH
jgi:lipopolysaccharide export system permease protein